MIGWRFRASHRIFARRLVPEMRSDQRAIRSTASASTPAGHAPGEADLGPRIAALEHGDLGTARQRLRERGGGAGAVGGTRASPKLSGVVHVRPEYGRQAGLRGPGQDRRVLRAGVLHRHERPADQRRSRCWTRHGERSHRFDREDRQPLRRSMARSPTPSTPTTASSACVIDSAVASRSPALPGTHSTGRRADRRRELS